MRKIALFFIVEIMVSFSYVFADDSTIDIFYTTDVRTHRITIDKNEYSLSIPQAPSDLRGETKLLSIRGIEKLQNIDTLYINFFDDFDASIFSNIEVNLIVFIDAYIGDINSLVNGKSAGIMFIHCTFPSPDIYIKIKPGKKKYLEISQCNLRTLPTIDGEIPVLNFSNTEIHEIPSSLPPAYKAAEKVIILGNGLNRMKDIPINFYFEGDSHFLIPYEFRTNIR